MGPSAGVPVQVSWPVPAVCLFQPVVPRISSNHADWMCRWLSLRKLPCWHQDPVFGSS